MTENNHLAYWSGLTVASIVALSSLLSILNGDPDNWEPDDRWVVGASIVSLLLSGFAYLAYVLIQEKFAGTRFEGLLAVIVWGIWSSAMNTLLDPRKGLAVNRSRVIMDANLFFSSWGAFVVALMLVTKCYKQLFEIKGSNTLVWLSFATSAFISMSSAGRKWQDEDCGDREFVDTELCQRSSFAVVLGLVSGVVGVSMVMSTNQTAMQATSIALLAAWCVGVARTTYQRGPGKDVSVLYFSTWTCLVLALHMASKALKFFFAAGYCQKDDEDEDDTAGTDVKVKSSPNTEPDEEKGSPPKKDKKKVTHEETKEPEDVRLARLAQGLSKEPSAYFDAEPEEDEEEAI